MSNLLHSNLMSGHSPSLPSNLLPLHPANSICIPVQLALLTPHPTKKKKSHSFIPSFKPTPQLIHTYKLQKKIQDLRFTWQ
jgi:hypothetical protein